MIFEDKNGRLWEWQELVHRSEREIQDMELVPALLPADTMMP